ncbi:MAG: histidine kinase dimerization/phospho-acceptor domain-containing protein, partial [Oscillospiraceae bacterium]
LLDENEQLLATYLKSVGKETSNRLTLVNKDGSINFDSDIDIANLDNHKDRPEIVRAMKNGFGEEKRRSDTIGEENYYYAVRLSNGTVLRVACVTKNFFGVVSDVMMWVILAIALVSVLSTLFARRLTSLILKPLNNLNLEKPLTNETYDELSPLLNKMEKQNKKISTQVDLLLEKNNEIEYIINKTSEAIIILKESGNVLSYNLAAKNLFDSSEFDSYLSICRDIDYIGAVESALNGKSKKVKIIIDDKIYSMSANSIEKADNTFAVFLFIRDITEFDNAEKMRREFSANVSHELKTPLTSIMGYAEIIENGIAKAADIPLFSEKIHSEAARLLALIEDIIK